MARAGKTTKVVAAIIAPSPGPRLTPESVQALNQVTRNQIERAESAARRPELTRRWETVTFLLSGVDDRRYPAAGFWRALAAYRRGDLAGGDAVRGQCTLAERDGTALDEERAVAAMLAARALRDGRAGDEVEGAPPEAAGFVRTTFVESAAQTGEGVRNDAPYAGPAPTSGGRLAAN